MIRVIRAWLAERRMRRNDRWRERRGYRVVKGAWVPPPDYRR